MNMKRISMLSRWAVVVAFVFEMGPAEGQQPPSKDSKGVQETSSRNTRCKQITICYNERPPYLEKTDQGVKGLTADPTNWAFQKSGIPIKWHEMPAKRQLSILQENTGCDCSVNWFKNPEREAFAKFTSPIYQDQPRVGVARADNKKLKSGETIEAVLSRPDIVLEIKDGWSYGMFIDSKIAQLRPKIDSTAGENVLLLKKIHAQRADFFFTTAAEADVMIAGSGIPKKDFRYVTFSDMPLGDKRYIMCSRQVDDEIIEKVNTAIQSFPR